MRKKQLIFSLLILSGFYSWSQQNNNWYFGRRAGLQFNSTPGQQNPVVLSNSAMASDEASASISDGNGDLLFYTNGKEVYNKTHQLMLNGDNLDGNISSTQVAIVPMPGNDKLYYIFTTGSIETGFVEGYRYSIVNMNNDNGKGEVVTKNTLLWSSCTERITMARHANGIDIWVITNDNNSNIFRSWLITCTGIASAVVSTVGAILDQPITANAGVLKVSPDGKFLAQTHFPFLDETFFIANFVQLFNFNNSTGAITNPKTIGFPDVRYTHCQFSPDSRLLYITRPTDKKIDQLDITLPTQTAIMATRFVLPTIGSYYDIQLAADSRIYLSRPSFEISTINNPDISGIGCNLQLDNIALFPGASFLGLPSHINDIVSVNDPNNGFNYTILDTCSGQVQFNGYTMLPNITSWSWEFGDGVTSTLQNPVHTFTPSNIQYTVKLKITSTAICGTIYKFKNIKPQGLLNSNTNFDFKNVCDSGYIRFTNTSGMLNEAGIQFVWDFGDGSFSTVTHPLHIYSNPGNYDVKLKMSTPTKCLDDSIIKKIEFATFSVVASPDQTIRVGESVLLSYSGMTGTSQWAPSLWLNESLSKSPVARPLEDIQYKITVTDIEGCKAVDSVKINVLQYDDIFVPNAFTPNQDGKNDNVKPYYPGTVTLKEFSIYNRWGKIMFSTNQRGIGWDGKINSELQSSGVYVWTFVAIDEKTKLEIVRKGIVMLIR